MAGGLLFAIARNLGQAATYKTLLADMEDASASGKTSEVTLASYLDTLKSLYLLDEIPGWMSAARSPKRVRTKPKRYLADPSLAVALLGMSPVRLFEDWQTFGTILESLCSVTSWYMRVPSKLPRAIRFATTVMTPGSKPMR